jgi:hypothetical protein
LRGQRDVLPVDQDAPLLRVYWRRLSNGWAKLETLGAGLADSLFGFRVYPIGPLLQAMEQSLQPPAQPASA